MASPKVIFVAIIGVGGVGKAFLPQLEYLRKSLAKQAPAVDLRLVLARRSTKQVFDADWRGLDILALPQTLDVSRQPVLPFHEIIDHLASAPGKVILVDNTSDIAIAQAYPKVLRQGISIVTPNKKAFSDSHELWSSIFASAANGTASPQSNGYIFHESSVGAGLPVLSTISDLLATGDTITKIEGVFSGTMSFLFNSFMPVNGGGGAFSAEVSKAKDLGYTEPDPRDDLNGLDVARKLTILARLCGLPVASPTSFAVESLIPKELESCSSGEEFLEKLPQYDSEMDARKSSAAKEGKVIRFVGSIDVASQSLKVGLEKFDLSHPIAALKGSDNIISFYTKRYGANPLIIQGAGAGGDVTAMGVSADLLRVVRLLQ